MLSEVMTQSTGHWGRASPLNYHGIEFPVNAKLQTRNAKRPTIVDTDEASLL
jgi:hypothetical protein